MLDEFCGDLCFECRCPQLHQQKMSRTEGCLGVLETITSWNATLCAAALGAATCRARNSSDAQFVVCAPTFRPLSLAQVRDRDLVLRRAALAFFVELEPCWKCRDLGAALAHEVGHALGFDDPAARPAAALHRINSSEYDCLRPWDGVEIGAVDAPSADASLMAFFGPLVQLVNASYNESDPSQSSYAPYQNVDAEGRRYGLRGPRRCAWRRTISTR